MARCHPEDDFNEETGYKIAYSKAMIKQAKAIIKDAEGFYVRRTKHYRDQRNKTIANQEKFIKHFENQIEYYSNEAVKENFN